TSMASSITAVRMKGRLAQSGIPVSRSVRRGLTDALIVAKGYKSMSVAVQCCRRPWRPFDMDQWQCAGVSPLDSVRLAGRLSHPLDKMRTRRRRVEPLGEILRFVGHASVAEFHDAHRIGRHAVIAEQEFADPEIAAAADSPDRKTLLVGLDEAALLNVMP